MSVPSTAFLDELHALTERRRASFVPLTSAFPGADEPSRASVRAAAKAGEGDVLARRPRDPRPPRGGVPRGPLRRRDRGPPARARRPGGGRHPRPVHRAAGRADGRGTRRRCGPHGRRSDDRDPRRVRRAARGGPRVRAPPHRRCRHRGVPRAAPGRRGRAGAAGPGAAAGHPGRGGQLGQGDPGAQRFLRRGRRRDHGPPVRVRRRGPPVPGPSSAPRDLPRGRRARVREPVHGPQRARRGGAELPGGRDAASAHPAERPRARRGARGRDAPERRAGAGHRRVLRAVRPPGDAQGPVRAAGRHRARVRRWRPARRPSWSGTPRRSRCRSAPTRRSPSGGPCTRRARAARSWRAASCRRSSRRPPTSGT